MKKLFVAVVLFSGAGNAAELDVKATLAETHLGLFSSDIGANGGVFCESKSRVEPDYGLLCRRACWVQNTSGACTWILPHLANADAIAVGSDGRAWIIKGQDVIADVNGQAVTITQLPENRRTLDFILPLAAEMVQVGGQTVALNTPYVLMDSGNAYVFDYGSHMWKLIANGPFDSVSGFWSDALGFQVPLVRKSTSLFLNTGICGQTCQSTDNIHSFGSVPETPLFGTNLAGQRHYAVAGNAMIAARKVRNEFSGLMDEGVLLRMNEDPPNYTWSTLTSWDSNGAAIPLAMLTAAPPKIDPKNKIDETSADSDPSNPGNGVMKFFGGSQGFNGYDVPLTGHHGLPGPVERGSRFHPKDVLPHQSDRLESSAHKFGRRMAGFSRALTILARGFGWQRA